MTFSRRTVLEGNTTTTPIQAQGPGGDARLGNAAGAPARDAGQRNNMPGRIPLGFLGRLFAPPARAANAPLLANNPGGGANAVNVAGQMPQEVLIQYHIQYQTQRHQAQPEHLQPVPRLQGFNRPGGVWQPWPVAENHDPRRQHNAHNNGNIEQAVPGPSGTAGGAATEATPRHPREAAALAALQRLDGGGATRTSVAGGSLPSGARERAALPDLIPLYGLDPSGNAIQHTSLSDIRRRINSRHSTLDRDTPRLSPVLTEEQLAVMDRLTREAIDERLRVLEGVSTAIHRCIDDLMRMRSILPSPSEPSPARASSSRTTSSDDDLLSQGQGKATSSNFVATGAANDNEGGRNGESIPDSAEAPQRNV